MLREGRISWIRRVREDLSILEFVFCCPQEREFGLFAQHTTMTPIHQTYALFGYKCLSCWIILVLIGIHVIDSRCRTGQGEGKFTIRICCAGWTFSLPWRRVNESDMRKSNFDFAMWFHGLLFDILTSLNVYYVIFSCVTTEHKA